MTPKERQKKLAAIHVKRQQLGMDEETYRAMLQTVAGVESAASLDARGLAKVLRHLRDVGAPQRAPKRAGKRPHNYDRLPEMVSKVEALLADMRLPWAYADAIARRVSGGTGGPGKDPGVEKLAWLKSPEHWRAIVAALHVEQEKRQLLARVDELLGQLGRGREHIAESKGWERRRPTLRALVAALHDELEQREEQP